MQLIGFSTDMCLRDQQSPTDRPADPQPGCWVETIYLYRDVNSGVEVYHMLDPEAPNLPVSPARFSRLPLSHHFAARQRDQHH
jgi:hypothetical protein